VFLDDRGPPALGWVQGKGRKGRKGKNQSDPRRHHHQLLYPDITSRRMSNNDSNTCLGGWEALGSRLQGRGPPGRGQARVDELEAVKHQSSAHQPFPGTPTTRDGGNGPPLTFGGRLWRVLRQGSLKRHLGRSRPR